MRSKVISIPVSFDGPECIELSFIFMEVVDNEHVTLHYPDGRRFYGDLADEVTVIFNRDPDGIPDRPILKILEDYLPVDASWMTRRS